MKAKDFVNEKWTEKYKKSINCQNPKGFSQKAHCAGRKKNEDATATMPNTATPDVKKEPGIFKSGVKKLGKVLGKGLGALDFIDAAHKFGKGDVPGGAQSTISGITYAVPVIGLPLGLTRDLAKSAGYDPLDYSSKSYPKGPNGETLYPITPFENKSNVLKGMLIAEQSDFSQMLKNITAQNPKGSSAEKILLGKFLGSDQGTYARNVLGKNHKGWVDHITWWLKMYQPKLQKEFTEVDFTDLESLAYDMYENYLAKQGQLGEGEVVSLEARRSPLVVAGSPFDWNVYDLRNNKMVASVIGGDRSESKLYEIRIKRSGMTPETRMPPTYLLTAGPNDTPPYKAYELVVPTERDKIEKSPGPGGTTKLHPDEDDVLRHFFKIMGSGRYYGYDVMLVEKGLDQWELVEKALGAKIMDIDDAMELGYTDVDPEDSSSIVYLGNKVNKDINEFFDAGDDDDDDPDEEDILHKLASMWWNGSEQQQVKIQNTLEAMGWSIGEDEGSDAGGVFVVQIDDEHGSSYISWSPKDLQLDEGYSAGAVGGAGLGEELNEYGEYDTRRIIQFSKDNPPDLDYLYQQFVQRMLNPENTVDPNEWILKVNEFYGLNYSWKDYQTRGRNDHTNNWQRIINRYVVNKK